MNPDDMDTFVFVIANKKAAVKLSKEMADIVSDLNVLGIIPIFSSSKEIGVCQHS